MDRVKFPLNVLYGLVDLVESGHKTRFSMRYGTPLITMQISERSPSRSALEQ